MFETSRLTSRRFARWFCGLLVCAAAPAQSVIVACQGGTGNCPTGGQVYTNLNTAIQDAVNRSLNLGESVTVLVIGGPWTDALNPIPANADVHILGVPLNVTQVVALLDTTGTGTRPTGGFWNLSFTDANGVTETTGDLPHNATAAAVQAALEALAVIGAGNVVVTGPDGGPYTIDFIGIFGNTLVPLLVGGQGTPPLAPAGSFVLVETTGGPFDVVVQGGVTINGGGDALIIEGITITGGDNGIRVTPTIATSTITHGAVDGTDAVPGAANSTIEVISVQMGATTFIEGTSWILSGGNAIDWSPSGPEPGAGETYEVRWRDTEGPAPTITRCYIRDNRENGVRVEGNARPLLVNCSISSNNEDGVHVGDGIAGVDGAFADILHCSIIDNSLNGVFVEDGEDVRVRNTLVYVNGSTQATGGIVLENNPFIDPDFGPVDGGTPVTISGQNFDQSPPDTTVFFGPTKVLTTEMINYTTRNDTSIVGDTPPSWTGQPGPVDVNIVRGDGFTITVPRAFTYRAETTGPDPIPYVTQAIPGWGPVDDPATNDGDPRTLTDEESAIPVYILGANFDPDCEVWFDFNGNGVIDPATDGQSRSVRWIDSGRLLVRPPARTTALGPIDVLVRNIPTGATSPAGPLREYEFRALDERLNITAIIPNSIGTTAGSGTSTDSNLLPDIFGIGIQQDAVVLIGGVVCAYSSVDADGSAIRDIRVPPSPSGAAGSFDVVVINPNGIRGIIPSGFTYFSTGEPRLDALPWRVANFVERTAGGTRSLLGTALDSQVEVIADPAGAAGGPVPYATVTPIAQRVILLPTFPADTNQAPLSLANPGIIPIPIDVRNADQLTSNAGTATVGPTTLYYAEEFTNQGPVAGGAVYFQINSATISTVGATDTIELDVLNYRNSYRIFVGDALVPPASITLVLAPNPPSNYNGIVRFPAPAQPEGVWGPVDIRVESPTGTTENNTGETLYYIAENAYSYRRAGENPEAYAVTPNIVPDNDLTIPIRIDGSNFVGPVASGVYTRVWIDGDATFGNGNEVDLGTQAATYSIDSFSSITFTIDLDAVDPTNQIPRDTPVALVLEQFDAVNGVSLTATPSRLNGAITFIDAGAAPTITSVTLNTGPVSGYNPMNGMETTIRIVGTNFGAAGTQPIVRFGSAQARFVSYDDTTGTIEVELPPAPGGLAQIVDVTVIRPADQQTATLGNGFTYYMDGAPFINEISPNHMDANLDPATDPVFVTLRGFNFDEIVDVVFGTQTVANVRSTSPNEIVVQVPDPDLLAANPGDYTGGLATVQVSVFNEPAVLSTESNQVDFFLYNDNRGSIDPAGPELLFNDVFNNIQHDYVNCFPGAGSISIEPGLSNTPWIGKLAVLADAPLEGTAGPFTATPFTNVDFELDPRPQEDGPEIGADELQGIAQSDACEWFLARVRPSPVGAMAADELTVRVQYTGDCGGAPFIVPQGGNPLDAADRMPLRQLAQLGDGAFLYTNTNPIQTEVRNGTGGTAGLLDQADLIADGHAAVYFEKNTGAFTDVIGFDDSIAGDHLTDGGQIQGQAVFGRHFLIDTIPPRIHVESPSYGPDGVFNAITADEIISDHNDAVTPQTIDLPSHPFGPPPEFVLPAGARYSPSVLVAPVDYLGGITLRPGSNPQGAQVYFNRGSVVNPDQPIQVPTARLNFSATIWLIDLPVLDSNGAVIPGTDIFTGRSDRQRAGFDPAIASLTEGAGGNAQDNILVQGPGQWDFIQGQAQTVGVAKVGTYMAGPSGTSNFGVFDPSLVPGDSVPDPSFAQQQNNDALEATWDLIDIPYPSVAPFHLSANLIGEDLAGNKTSDSLTFEPDPEDFPGVRSFLLDPFQVWWIVDVQSRLTPDRDGQTTNRATFTMRLDRSFDPQAQGGPPPVFTYKVWAGDTDPATGYASVYNEVFGWTPWSTDTNIDLAQDLSPAQFAAIRNRWVLIVSQGADEAGNVELWPNARFPTDDTIDLSDPANSNFVRSLPNWQRFYLTDREFPDTRVEALYWHDINDNNVIDAGEPTFSGPIVPMPQNTAVPVKALFRVGVVRTAGMGPEPIHVGWQFIEDGLVADAEADAHTFSPDSEVIQFVAASPAVLPDPPYEIQDPDNFLGDPNRRRAVTYVFRAAAFYDAGGGLIIQDLTPSNVYFTVVPTGVSNYVNPPDEADAQPFKEQEIE